MNCCVERLIKICILILVSAAFSLSFAVAEELVEDSVDEDFLFFEESVEETEEVKEETFWDKLSINGYLKNETAYRFREPRSITKIRNIFYLNAEYPFGLNAKFNFSGWAYYDLVYDLFDYSTISARLERNRNDPLTFIDNLREEEDNRVAEIREFYFDFYMGDLDVRIGKQYVVWGVLEGIRITDEINPQDFRELIMPELLDYRVPLWTLKLDYYWGDSAIQFLWIPDVQFHKHAPRGSEWELTQDACKPDRDGLSQCDPAKTLVPETFVLENSEVGLRWTTNLFDTEISFSYFYTWDDFQVLFRTAPLNKVINPEAFPTYTRIHMYGTTFVKQLGPVILKGEAAYVTGKYFGISDVDEDEDGILDNLGELKKDHLRWGIGVDLNVNGWDVSPAFVQWVIFDYEEGIIVDEFDDSVNLFLRREFPQKSTTFQLLYIHLLNLKEAFLQPKLIFQLTDRFTITTGFDMFFGDSSRFGASSGGANVTTIEERARFIGNFDDNDRVFVEFKYSF